MENILEINNLKFSWPGSSTPILDIESFQIKKGERVFLQGPSGSGKSSLLNLIGGVLSPQEGNIEVLGTDLSKLSIEKRDQFRGDHMGFIFQMFNLLPYFSAIENINLPCEFSKYKKNKIIENAKSLNYEVKRLLLELKLDEDFLSKRKVNQLSVGQQQRVAAARALMGRPEILIADEPTSSLDANVRDSFLKLLFNECENFGTSLIFVSHDHDLGKQFDRVVSLKEINKANSSHTEEGGILL